MSLTRRIKNVYQPVVTRVAGGWRRRLGRVARIGVTGSVGKTSTKDFIHAVLRTRFDGIASFDTTNNAYSAARTLLATRPSHRYCVQEVGASGPGSLDPILRTLRPTVAVLTCIGKEHYSGFRGEEGVFREKAKLVAALPADGVAVLNADDPWLAGLARREAVRTVTYGMDPAAAVRATRISADYPDCLSFDVQDTRSGGHPQAVATRLYGRHMLYPALAALAVGAEFGIPFADGARALREASPAFGRMRRYRAPDGVIFIDDSYKAGFWSLAAAFDFVAAARASRKWIVLGSVSDHTVARRSLARKLARLALRAAANVVLIGPHTGRLRPEDGVHGFATVAEANGFLHRALRPGDLVFVKGLHRRDHLSRLVLSRLQPVGCWREDCRRDTPCHTCPQLS